MDKIAADRSAPALLAFLLLVAFVCGGGGIGAALANLSVQLTALAVLAFRRESAVRFSADAPCALRLLIIATLALPLLQLVPLPESIWSALPARDLVSGSRDLANGAGWAPFSVAPLRTLLAASALITPLAVLLAGWTLPRERLIQCAWLVVVFGIVTVLMGAVQLGSGTEVGTLYGSRSPGKILLGTFANRNSTGLFLVFGMALAALLPAPRPHPAIIAARLAVCALLLLAIVLTQSRTALVLALVPSVLGVLRGIEFVDGKAQRRATGRKAMLVLGSLGLLGAAAVAVVAAAPDRIASTLERFEARDDSRRFIWEDATYSAGRYWPLGAGTGTFDEIYQIDESLENMTLRRAGRAHNDYIELTIEAGLPGIALAVMWLALVGWLSWQARRSSQRWVAWAGSAFLLCIALQSVTDYPLRAQTILAFCGFALLLLSRVASDRARART
ncbi:O-antigen ligase family protein [Erythrobacter sp. R86502]|uniref:O-antigen ligase family protein n=1 Tax=Erythrobacter sp. R86502 TaxID=3093846 RepID=UPI0036D3A630